MVSRECQGPSILRAFVPSCETIAVSGFRLGGSGGKWVAFSVSAPVRTSVIQATDRPDAGQFAFRLKHLLNGNKSKIISYLTNTAILTFVNET